MRRQRLYNCALAHCVRKRCSDRVVVNHTAARVIPSVSWSQPALNLRSRGGQNGINMADTFPIMLGYAAILQGLCRCAGRTVGCYQFTPAQRLAVARLIAIALFE
jgi:hypothetical protein